MHTKINAQKWIYTHTYIYMHTHNTLQHTATHCNILQHTATYCNILQHTATHCNILQHTATSTYSRSAWRGSRNPHIHFMHTYIYTHQTICTHTDIHTHTCIRTYTSIHTHICIRTHTTYSHTLQHTATRTKNTHSKSSDVDTLQHL